MTDGTTGKPVIPSSMKGNLISSLFTNGDTNPAALNVEFDIPIASQTTPNPNAFIRVWGLGLKDISAALDLTPKDQPAVNVSFSAGMSKGLPLANPKQQGLIMKGTIIQAWGNWIGTDMTLDMNFQPTTEGIGSPTDPSNFPFTWPKGTPLKSAIQDTLRTAFPGKKQLIDISTLLVLNRDEYGTYQGLQQFAAAINNITKPIIGGSYQGVQMASDGDSVTVWDGTKTPDANAVKKIEFQDLLGQPTWISVNEITVKLVLRGDLNISDVIKLPEGLATQGQQSWARFQDKSAFTGNYQILSIQHYGNFRQPDASSWNTTVKVAAQLKASS